MLFRSTAYAKLKQRWPDYHDYDDWIAAPINNAKINTIDTYYDLVPGFNARLDELGGELPMFYREVESMRRKSLSQRREHLAGALVRNEQQIQTRWESASVPVGNP